MQWEWGEGSPCTRELSAHRLTEGLFCSSIKIHPLDILEFGELFLFPNNSPDIRGNYRKEKKHTQNN